MEASTVDQIIEEAVEKAAGPDGVASATESEAPPDPPEHERVSDDDAKHQAEMVERLCEAANVHLACEGYANPQTRAVARAVFLALSGLRP